MRSSGLMNIRFVAGLSAVLLVPAAVVEAAGAQPRIEVPVTSKDGGQVEEGTVVPFQFELENRGQADLEISQVKPSCGCTVTKWVQVIKPGARGTIDAQMNTLSFRGAVTKHLTVFSNDPDRPQLDLTISAHMLPLLNVSPGFDASLAVDDKPAAQVFTLERRGGKPMKIVQVTSYAAYVKSVLAPLPGQGRYKLTVTAGPDAPLGRSKAAVVVWTDLPSAPSFTFFVTVDRGIVTVPPMAFLGVVPRQLETPIQASITIQRNSTPFHVRNVAVSDPHLSARIEPVRQGSEYRVTVTYAGGWAAGRQRQTLTVTTDDPKQPVIEIPVQAIVQPQIASATSPH